jgi:hypothetical protein
MLSEISTYLSANKYQHAYCTAFGVIVEATSPVYRSKSNTYVARARIIDESNESCNVYLTDK